MTTGDSQSVQTTNTVCPIKSQLIHLIAALLAAILVSSQWELAPHHHTHPPQPQLAQKDPTALPASATLVPGRESVSPPTDVPPTLPSCNPCINAIPRESLPQVEKGPGLSGPLDTVGLRQALATLNGGAELLVPPPPLTASKDLAPPQTPPPSLAVSAGGGSGWGIASAALPVTEADTQVACNDRLHGYTSCLRLSGRKLAAPRFVAITFPGQNSEAQLPAPREGASDELSRMRALRQALEKLPKGKIYLDAPMEMRIGDRRSINARVGVNVPDDILRGRTRVGDQMAEGSLRLSHEMVAILTGPGFEIKPTTPEQQPVAEGFPTVWEWEIEAKQDGVQELEATLYVLVPIAESAAARERIDSYIQKISVSVKELTWGEWLQSVREEVNAVKAIAIALGGIATAVLGWLGISAGRRSRSRTKPSKPRMRAAKSGGL